MVTKRTTEELLKETRRNFKLGFAKKLISFGVSEVCRKALEKEFPELTESEDERIRDEIIGYFEHYSGGDNISVKFPRWISYLEKQKELTKDIKPDYPAHYFYDGEKMHFLGNPAMEEKQKEQKPELCDMGRWDEESYNNGIHHVLQNLEAYGLTKQKPAEWSEEDEMMLTSIISTLKLTNGAAQMKIDWLNNLVKSLRPQPHWKPSEEHFQGLRRAITKVEKGSDAWNSLTDLYEHLKKL